jgi:hypothetical protein
MLRKPHKKSRLEPPIVVSSEQATEVFPSVRYFQIHFEFLQEQLSLILHNQERLQHQIQQLRANYGEAVDEELAVIHQSRKP